MLWESSRRPCFFLRDVPWSADIPGYVILLPRLGRSSLGINSQVHDNARRKPNAVRTATFGDFVPTGKKIGDFFFRRFSVDFL